MSNPFNVHETKTQLSRLLDRTHTGEDVVLSKADKPDPKFVALEKTKRKLGFITGYVDDSFFGPLPDAWLDVRGGQ